MKLKKRLENSPMFPVVFTSDGKYIIFDVENYNGWDVVLYDMLFDYEQLDSKERYDIMLHNVNSNTIKRLKDVGVSKIYFRATDKNIKKITSFAIKRYKEKGGD